MSELDRVKMQWVIDLITERVLASFQHIIVMWFKPIADIPDGWGLCDGTQGLPDLRDKFIKGAPVDTDPGGTGGSQTHRHGYISEQHEHDIPSGNAIAGGTDYDNETDWEITSGQTEYSNGEPPYYKMVFIGKL